MGAVCTGIIPLPRNFEPDRIVHKTRIKTRTVTVKVLKEREDENGNKYQEEVEEQKQEEYEELIQRKSTRRCYVARGKFKNVWSSCFVYYTEKSNLSYVEVNKDGVNVEKTREEIEEPIFSKPIKVQ